MLNKIKNLFYGATYIKDIEADVLALQLEVTKLNKDVRCLKCQAELTHAYTNDLDDELTGLEKHLGLEADTVDDILVFNKIKPVKAKKVSVKKAK